VVVKTLKGGKKKLLDIIAVSFLRMDISEGQAFWNSAF
jgi:hypothetical protein